MKLLFLSLALAAIIISVSSLTPNVVASDYNNTASAINGAVTIYWNIYANNTIEVALQAQGTGWIGFGIGTGMPDADIIMGSVVGGTVSVGDYVSTAEVPPTLDTLSGGTDNILDSNGQETGGVTTIKFLRLLDTGDSLDKPIVNGSVAVIIAYNPTSDDKTAYHGGTNRQSLSINFISGGGVTVITDNKNAYRIAHGVLMAFGWGFFIWVGMFIARFFKSLGHPWFILHIVLNAIGLAAVIAGLVLAIIMVDQDFNQPDKLTRAHSIMGVIVVALGVIQPVIGTIADRMFNPSRSKTPVFPDKIHWWIGRISMIASIAVIFMGFAVYDTGIIAFIIYGVWNLILLIAFIVLSVKKGTGHGEDIELK